jgi:hypothetical protein
MLRSPLLAARSIPGKHPSTDHLPDALDRQSILNGIASVKANRACANH